eukprot:90572-Amphidinium_carterae.1
MPTQKQSKHKEYQKRDEGRHLSYLLNRLGQLLNKHGSLFGNLPCCFPYSEIVSNVQQAGSALSICSIASFSTTLLVLGDCEQRISDLTLLPKGAQAPQPDMLGKCLLSMATQICPLPKLFQTSTGEKYCSPSLQRDVPELN